MTSSFPPNRRKQIEAVGADPRNKEIKAGCCTPDNWDDAFQPKSPLQPGDWLSGPGKPERSGQTFAQFKRKKHKKRPTEQQKIYLVPIGSLTSVDGKSAIDIDAVAVYTRAYFMAPVEVIDGIHDSDVKKFRGSRRSADGTIEQLKTDACHRSILRHKPDDAFCAVGVTMYDLYPGEGWNFVFGEAYPRSGTGVFSFARYRENIDLRVNQRFVSDQHFLMRCCKVVVHEIGHLYNIEHCVFFQYCMNGANHLEEDDTQPMHLCPVDLRKLQLISLSPDGKRFSIIERYETLYKWYKEHNFDNEAAWVRKRLLKIRDPPARSETSQDISEEKHAANDQRMTITSDLVTSSTSKKRKPKTDDFSIFKHLCESFVENDGAVMSAEDVASHFGIKIGRAKSSVRMFLKRLDNFRHILESNADINDGQYLVLFAAGRK